MSLLATAISAQNYATCALRAETDEPLSITGRLMFRDYPDMGLYVTGFYNGFEAFSLHAVAVNESAFDGATCESTGLPSSKFSETLNDFFVDSPSTTMCY